MKTGRKIFWIVCAVLVIIGIGMAGAGVLLGGMTGKGREYLNLRDTIKETSADLGSQKIASTGEYVTEYSGVTELDLDVFSFDVVVRPADIKYVRVSTEKIKEKYRKFLAIEEDANTVSIYQNGEIKMPAKDAGTLYVEIPREQKLESVELGVGAGYLQAQGVKAGELTVEVGAGRADITDYETKELDAECEVGQMRLEGDTTESASLECGIGKILYITEDCQSYNYDMECGIGTINIDGKKVEGIGAGQSIDNGKSRMMELTCNIGTIEVRSK